MKRIALFLLLTLLLPCRGTAESPLPAARDEYPIVISHQLLDNAFLALCEDENGTRTLVGGVQQEDGLVITRSQPLPEGMMCTLRNGGAFLYTDQPEYRALAIALAPTGVWQVEETSCSATGYSLTDSFFITGWGQCLFGDLNFSPALEDVDWLAFPVSAREAESHMYLNNWGVTACETPLLPTPGAEDAPLTLLAGTPVKLLERADGFCRVAVWGQQVQGYLPCEAVCAGRDQYLPDGKHTRFDLYDAPHPKLKWDAADVPVMDHPQGSVLLTYADKDSAFPVLLGYTEDGWLLVYDQVSWLTGYLHQDWVAPPDDPAQGNG